MSNQTNRDHHRQELIAEIVAAFDGVEREDGITIHEALAIDDYKSAEEQLAARGLDTEQRWQDVPAEAIVACDSALSFLDPKGFRYYLPAFMVCGLTNLDNDAGGAIDTCKYHLLHEYPRSLRKSDPASIAAKYGFTDAQCRAIAHFLRFAVGDDDAFTVQHATTLQAVAKWELFANDPVSAT
jgi:hypothetical protein